MIISSGGRVCILSRIRTLTVAAVLSGLAFPGLSLAQTTGALSGTVTDQTRGALPGTSIVAVHDPTATTYEAVTDQQGVFLVPSVRVGGPYTITATLAGFREGKQSG